MIWTTIIWSAGGGICLALAGVHLLVWVKSRNSWANLLFAIAAVSAAASSLFELSMMHAQTPEAYGELIRWMYVPVGVMVVSLAWFVHFFLRAGRVWLIWLLSALWVLILALNFHMDLCLNFIEITGLHHIPLWDETVVVPFGVHNPWVHFGNGSTILLIIIAIDAAIPAWRRGNRRQAGIIGCTVVGATVLGEVLSLMLAWGILSVPYTLSLVFQMIVFGMAYELSADLIKAGQLSKELNQSQERMSLAARAANLGMWEWDLVLDEIWANEVSHARFGTEASERFTFDRFFQQVHPEDREATRQTILSAREGGGELRMEYRVVVPDGTVQWLKTRGQAERDVNNKPFCLRGVTLDITERKMAEADLKASEARLKAAQRIAHLGNWELDLLTDTLTWSDEIFRIFEMDPKHFSPSYETFLATIHPDDRAGVDAAYKQSIKNRKPYTITHRLLLPDGRIKYVQEECETDYSPEGRPLRSAGTVQDITDRINAQKERRELRHELTHFNRIMTLNELSASLAHEINQPLGAIMNNAAAAKTSCSRLKEGREEIVEILNDVILDTNRAGQIVRKVREIVKKGEALYEYEVLHMAALVKEVFELLQNTFKMSGIAIHLDTKPVLSPIRGDRIRLQQVLINLVTNAVDAMKESTIKDLTVRLAMLSPNELGVSVSDSGPGIHETIRDNVFKPFMTTKKDGLGIGLRICRSIIEEHGGRIWLEHDTEQGATFSFTLNAYQGDRG